MSRVRFHKEFYGRTDTTLFHYRDIGDAERFGRPDRLMRLPLSEIRCRRYWWTHEHGEPTHFHRFRDFDIDTGEELWVDNLPTSKMTVPMTYSRDGRQFIVRAAGGHHGGLITAKVTDPCREA